MPKITKMLTTKEFAEYLRTQQEFPILQQYDEIVNDFDDQSRTLRNWLMYLCSTLAEHINTLMRQDEG